MSTGVYVRSSLPIQCSATTGICYKSAICPGCLFLVDFLARFIVRVPLAAF